MKLLFSIYHQKTKSPTDKSYLCFLDWPDGYDPKDPISISSIQASGRVSGLYRKDNIIWCGVGIGVQRFDLQSMKFTGPLITHKYINQLHSLYVSNDNKIFLCSTGLDLLMILDFNGKLLKTWHPEHGSSLSWLKDKDYRYINYKDTGYNKHHLNHVICHGSHIFVCCGKSGVYYQLDSDLNVIRKIKRQKNYPYETIAHDGLIDDGKLIFTDAAGDVLSWDLTSGKLKTCSIATRWLRGLAKHKDEYVIGVSAAEGLSSIIRMNFKTGVKRKIKIKAPFTPPMIYSIIPI